MDSKTQHNLLLLLVFALAVAATQFKQSHAQMPLFERAEVPTLWINAPNITRTVTYPDGTTIKALLHSNPEPPAIFGPSFAAGFYCRSAARSTTPCRSNFLFGLCIVYTHRDGSISNETQNTAQLVWSANRGRPVGENATLELGKGGLVLRDADGSRVWSTAAHPWPVQSILLLPYGNMMLMGGTRSFWWLNRYPTDSLIPGHRLPLGRRLRANLSPTGYWREGRYYLATTTTGFAAYANNTTGTPRPYYEYRPASHANGRQCYMQFDDGGFGFFQRDSVVGSIPLAPSPSLQFLRLDSDGQLRHYQWRGDDGRGWRPVAELLHFSPPN